MSSRPAVPSSVLEFKTEHSQQQQAQQQSAPPFSADGHFAPPQQPVTYSHGYPTPPSHLTALSPVSLKSQQHQQYTLQSRTPTDVLFPLDSRSYQTSPSHLSRLSPGQPRPASQHQFPPPRATATDTFLLPAPTSFDPRARRPSVSSTSLFISESRIELRPVQQSHLSAPPAQQSFLHPNSVPLTQGPVSYVQKQYSDTAPSPVSTNALNSRPNPPAQNMTSRSAPAPAHWPPMPTQSSSQSSASFSPIRSLQSQSQLPISTDAYPPRPPPTSSSRPGAFAPHTSRDKDSVKVLGDLLYELQTALDAQATDARADRDRLQRGLDQMKTERDLALQRFTTKGWVLFNAIEGQSSEQVKIRDELAALRRQIAEMQALADERNREVNELRRQRDELRSVCVHGAAQEMKIVPKVEDIKIKLEPEFTPKTENVEDVHLELQYPHTPFARMDHKPVASTSAQTLDVNCASSSSSFALKKNAATEGKRSRAEYEAEGAVYGADADADADAQRAKKRARAMEPSLGPAFPLSPEMARDVVDVKRLNCPLQWFEFMEVRKREE
ncbi:hypothetical protein DFH06DRAFT_1359180 [Mycena polygramma]|nr:hypothetical protein DFH06DRAFT_1359180 [Mycena polygramma]